MTYVSGNPRTKKALKAMVAAGTATMFNPGIGKPPTDGVVYLEGPHYPEPHKWYAEGTMKNGKLVRVK